MIVRWTDVQELVNVIGEEKGRQCECGKFVEHEHLETYAISDGRLLHVKKIQTNGKQVRIWVDA